MGIPSYYRKLKDSVPGLVCKTKKSSTYGLYFDFNCLIYHVLHKDTVPPYPTGCDSEARVTWENSLIDAVLKYVRKIVDIIGPSDEILISVDGVVPFAKMKQQRLRRFKSALSSVDSSWDKNSITPGTYFMERLGKKLHGLGSGGGGGRKWIIQDASMPGEGEQKVMSHLRNNVPADKDIVVYGLDADLIVLSLLDTSKSGRSIHLFRENIEYGEMIYDALGEETYTFLNVNLLEKYLTSRLGGDHSVILDYAMAMSFLGNDFLPHSLSQKMSEEGHEVMLEFLSNLISSGKRLMNNDTTWNIEGVREILQRFALTEDHDMYVSIRKKITHNPVIKEDTTPDFYPAEKVEYDFFEDGTGGAQARGSQLKPTWRKTYYENYVGGAHALVARTAAKHYYEGLHWIRAYYLGEPVAIDWYYPFFLPPLWKDIVVYLDKYFMAACVSAAATVFSAYAQPQEQLAMVLPLESWWLIRDKTLKQVPYMAPQYWPVQYKMFSCGKKWMWECESQIPLLTLRTLRRIVAQ